MSRVSVLTLGFVGALGVTGLSPENAVAGPAGTSTETQGEIPGESASESVAEDARSREAPDETWGDGEYEPWVSGIVGAGVFDDRLSAAIDVALDLAGPRYAIGFGARLRWMREEGFRDSEWDEISEWASLLRYLTYQRASHDVQASFALGQLGGARLGHGSVLDGYASGVHLDHRRLGAQLRVEGVRFGVESLVDDVVSPRIAGTRVHGYHRVDRLRIDIGISGIADFFAPGGMTGADPEPDPGETEHTMALAVLDGSIGVFDRDRRVSGQLYLDIVAGGAPGLAGSGVAGFHAGAMGQATIARTTVGLRGELQVGSDRYIGNWFGPLYERDRVRFRAMDSQLDVARAGGLGGSGGAVDATVLHPRVGDLRASYRWRPGLGELFQARVAAPYIRDVQGALWSAVERTATGPGPGGEPDLRSGNWVVAGEMRVRLPRRLFATAELSRLYRDGDGGSIPPVWTAMIGIGTRVAPYAPGPRSGL